MAYRTDQETFWAGEFGDEYALRNRTPVQATATNSALFAQILRRTIGVASAIEFGANIGNNLRALRVLLPEAQLSAVEINASAVEELRSLGGVDVHHASLLDFDPPRQWDFAFTKGVLIHLNPATLPQAYDVLYACSRRYVCVAEYYSPTPAELPYRGHSGKLFKRDFAGDLLDRFADLRLVDYGFAYRRDPNFRQDDLNWFLLEKVSPATDGDAT